MKNEDYWDEIDSKFKEAMDALEEDEYKDQIEETLENDIYMCLDRGNEVYLQIDDNIYHFPSKDGNGNTIPIKVI